MFGVNLEHIFPVDFEARKGSFGAFANLLFFKLDGAVEVTGRREHQPGSARPTAPVAPRAA